MNTKKIVLFALITTGVFTSCTNTEEIYEPKGNNSNPNNGNGNNNGNNNNPNNGNRAEESSSKKGWQNIGIQLKSFFTKSDASLMDNEIDYYHQYIYPHKVNKLLKNNNKQNQLTYIPLSKRK